jgi:hypothetical protein
MPNSNVPGQINQRAPAVVGNVVLGGSRVNTTNIPPFVQQPPLVLTKFQFRKLFTLAERMAIDNIQYSGSTPASVKAAVNTMQLDLQVSGEVDLHLKDTNDGVRFLASVGLITVPRAIRILQNLPPL